MEVPYISSSNFIRKAFLKREIPESAINTMIASLSSATLRQYSKPLKLWNEFCIREKTCPFNPDMRKIIEFLELSFQNMNNYSSLNTYRSAISLITDKEV